MLQAAVTISALLCKTGRIAYIGSAAILSDAVVQCALKNCVIAGDIWRLAKVLLSKSYMNVGNSYNDSFDVC
jgi:hypothetical protein